MASPPKNERRISVIEVFRKQKSCLSQAKPRECKIGGICQVNPDCQSRVGGLEEMTMKFVVIGGDATGLSAASRVKRNRPDIEVTVLEKTMDVSYSA